MNREPQTLTNPVLIDAALAAINGTLESEILWLDQRFGKCEHLNDNGIKKPVIYSGIKEYIDLFPDDKIGNFSFFNVEDGAQYSHEALKTQINAKCNLIIWGDYRKVFTDSDRYSIENIKFQIDEALKKNYTPLLRITPERFFERPENVYSGFTVSEITNTRTMRPYFCLRYSFDLKYTEAKIC